MSISIGAESADDENSNQCVESTNSPEGWKVIKLQICINNIKVNKSQSTMFPFVIAIILSDLRCNIDYQEIKSVFIFSLKQKNLTNFG